MSSEVPKNKPEKTRLTLAYFAKKLLGSQLFKSARKTNHSLKNFAAWKSYKMLSCSILYLLVLTFQTSLAIKVPEDNGQRLQQPTPVLNLPLPPNIQLDRNFVYTQEAQVTVNPDFVHIVRHVDTSGLNSALTAISSIEALHNQYCTEMTSLVEPKPKN